MFNFTLGKAFIYYYVDIWKILVLLLKSILEALHIKPPTCVDKGFSAWLKNKVPETIHV